MSRLIGFAFAACLLAIGTSTSVMAVGPDRPKSLTLVTASEAIRKTMPEFGPAKIAAGTYRLLDKDYVTVGVPNFVIGRADLPADLVYQLVKATFENQPRLVKATSAAGDTLPQNALKNTFLPFHPGAVRYYREIGVAIPETLAATN
jgi:uncharacterized protein